MADVNLALSEFRNKNPLVGIRLNDPTNLGWLLRMTYFENMTFCVLFLPLNGGS